MEGFKSLKDHVYDYIAEKINDGSLTFDKKIDEQTICQELKISRTPVREALIQLATEGYLENVPRRGFFLRRVDEKKAADLYNIIGRLDGLAAALAMDSITDKEITMMKDIITDMDQAIDSQSFDTYYKLQIEFHNVYIDRCNNDELIRLLNQLRKNFIRQKYSDQNDDKYISEVLKNINNDHRAIVEIFEKRDKAEIESHIRDFHWNSKNARLDSY
jgi:DNA-binding GntR family transcriptional regulator